MFYAHVMSSDGRIYWRGSGSWLFSTCDNVLCTCDKLWIRWKRPRFWANFNLANFMHISKWNLLWKGSGVWIYFILAIFMHTWCWERSKKRCICMFLFFTCDIYGYSIWSEEETLNIIWCPILFRLAMFYASLSSGMWYLKGKVSNSVLHLQSFFIKKGSGSGYFVLYLQCFMHQWIWSITLYKKGSGFRLLYTCNVLCTNEVEPNVE